MDNRICFGALRKGFTVEEASKLILNLSDKDYSIIFKKFTDTIDAIPESLITPDSDEAFDGLIDQLALIEKLRGDVTEFKESIASINEVKVALEQELYAKSTSSHPTSLEFFSRAYDELNKLDFNHTLITKESLHLWCIENGIKTHAFSSPKAPSEHSIQDDNSLIEVRIDLEAVIDELTAKMELHQSNASLPVSDALKTVIISLNNVVNTGSNAAKKILEQASTATALGDELRNNQQIVLEQRAKIQELENSLLLAQSASKAENNHFRNNINKTELSSAHPKNAVFEKPLPYLDQANSAYAFKLSAAIKAWLAISENPPLKTITIKQAIEKWLIENEKELGLIKANGKPNRTAIEDISTISNFNPLGGSPKSG